MAVESLGTTESNGFGQTITASASTNTKGSYAELIASSTISAVGIMLVADMASSGGSYLMDISTGAGGAEVVKIADIMLTGATNGSLDRPLLFMTFPFIIGSGTRVAARIQSTNSSETIRLKGWLLGDVTNKFHSMTRSTTYGANTADSGGVQVDPGGSAGTKGSYSEITSSSTNAIDWLVVCIGAQNNTVMQDAGWMFDIATGAASSEVVVVGDINVRTSTSETLLPCVQGPFPVSIAASTRIAARAQSSIIDATDRLLDVTVIGFDGTTAAGGGGAHFAAYIK